MSWGERSCVHAGNCPIPRQCSIETCNVNCREYKWDKKTQPDSSILSKRDYNPLENSLPPIMKQAQMTKNQAKRFRKKNRR